MTSAQRDDGIDFQIVEKREGRILTLSAVGSDKHVDLLVDDAFDALSDEQKEERWLRPAKALLKQALSL